jgi:hypothetical protein
MLVQSQKAAIFQAGKRSIQNQKLTDYWDNAKIICPVHFRRISFQHEDISIASLRYYDTNENLIIERHTMMDNGYCIAV